MGPAPLMFACAAAFGLGGVLMAFQAGKLLHGDAGEGRSIARLARGAVGGGLFWAAVIALCGLMAAFCAGALQ